ncbi:MAG: hypothetical protein U1E27_03935 [Kiritimatiellia bacterium]|nr:hypothetical protein [Kiritimatiellia bacterium]
MFSKRLFTILGLGILLSSRGFAGLVLEATTRSGDSISERAVIAISGDRLAIRTAEGEKGALSTALVFQASSGEILFFDHDTKQVMSMNAATLRGLSRQLQGLLDMLPPEHRAQLGALAGKAPKIDVEALGRTEKIGGRECAGHRVLKDGKPEMEVWSFPFAEIGAEAADLKTYKAFFKMMLEMAAAVPGAADQAGAAFLGLDRIDGLPARVRKLSDPVEVTDIVPAVRAVDASLFESPAGYQKAALPFPLMTP